MDVTTQSNVNSSMRASPGMTPLRTYSDYYRATEVYPRSQNPVTLIQSGSGYGSASTGTGSTSLTDDMSQLDTEGTSISQEVLAEKLRKVALERELEERGVSCQDGSRIRANGHMPPMERFHLNEGPNENDSTTDRNKEDPGIVCRNTFAGRKDFWNPRSLDEVEIRSPRGTVRGFKNRVRAGIATFVQTIEEEETAKKTSKYLTQEKGKIVFYSTRIQIVRETYEKCKTVRNILQTHMVRYEERDLCLNRETQTELKDRLEIDTIELPQVFVDGRLLGNGETIQCLNETGELRSIFKHFQKIRVRSACSKCGGYRYVPCSICHGSKKSLHRNYKLQEFRALRCINCTENGLVRCDACLDQQE